MLFQRWKGLLSIYHQYNIDNIHSLQSISKYRPNIASVYKTELILAASRIICRYLYQQLLQVPILIMRDHISFESISKIVSHLFIALICKTFNNNQTTCGHSFHSHLRSKSISDYSDMNYPLWYKNSMFLCGE